MAVDLSGCAAEPIRVPGAIQPHGWLVAFERSSSRVAAYSDNCQELTGLSSGAAQAAALQQVVDELLPLTALSGSDEIPAYLGTTVINDRRLDATIHRSGSLSVVEFEPASPQAGTRAVNNPTPARRAARQASTHAPIFPYDPAISSA